MTKILIFLASIFIITQFSHAEKPSIASPAIPRPFRLMGDGIVRIQNVKTGQTKEIRYLDDSQKIIADAFYEIDELFGFPTAQRGEHISARMIAMLDHYSDYFSPTTNPLIIMNSGYRSPKYNAGLRSKGKGAAKTSTHMDGMALDFKIEGVSGKAMWEHIRQENCCGVGHYGGDVIHLDAGRPRFWQSHTSKVKTKASAHNRYIYLSTEYDRYQAEQTLRLFFTSVSDFGFGVKNKILFIDDDKKTKAKLTALDSSSKSSCLMINERKEARFLYLKIPKKLKNKTVKIKVEFCQRPFEDMPSSKISNPIEVL